MGTRTHRHYRIVIEAWFDDDLLNDNANNGDAENPPDTYRDLLERDLAQVVLDHRALAPGSLTVRSWGTGEVHEVPEPADQAMF